jgi:Uma2 family endonuclease
MLMATKTRRWTRRDLARMPDDGNRYEVLDGELFVTPQAAFGHQYVAFAIMRPLFDYCSAHNIGEVVGPGAVVWDDNELQPDVQVIPGRHAWDRKIKWIDLPLPLLVVEVLSDSTERRDLGKKREAYARLGIPSYWIVDIDNRRISSWPATAANPTVAVDSIQWAPRANLPPLEIPLAAIFGTA